MVLNSYQLNAFDKGRMQVTDVAVTMADQVSATLAVLETTEFMAMILIYNILNKNIILERNPK